MTPSRPQSSRDFAIWSEGYSATGQRSGAIYHGTVRAITFKAACAQRFVNDPYYDRGSNTYWSCGLFDNAVDAQVSFG